MNIKKYKTDFILLGIIVLLVAADLITKLVTEGMMDFDLVPWALTINSVHNTGAAFGFLSNTTWGIVFFSIFSFTAICLIVFFHLKNTQRNLLYYFSFCLILGGAIGNFIDRVSLRYVRDFIETGFFPWATCNIADLFLTAGTICACIYFIFYFKFKEDVQKEKIEIQTREE